jgi:hypothetical protein
LGKGEGQIYLNLPLSAGSGQALKKEEKDTGQGENKVPVTD